MAKSTHPARAAHSDHSAPMDPGDVLYDRMQRMRVYIQEQWRSIALVAAGIIAGGALLIGVQESRSGVREDAADALFAATEADDDAARLEAFAGVVDEYPATGAALQATFAGAALAFEREDYPQARALYQKLYDAQPESPLAPAALVGLGAALEAEGDSAGAKASYEKVLDAYPTSYARAQAQLALARLAEADGRTDEALELYRSIVTDAPGSAWERHAASRLADLAPTGAGLATGEPPAPAAVLP